jgi:hypothetical protein
VELGDAHGVATGVALGAAPRVTPGDVHGVLYGVSTGGPHVMHTMWLTLLLLCGTFYRVTVYLTVV